MSLRIKIFPTTSYWKWHRKRSVSENPRCAQLQHVGFQFPISVHWSIHLPMEVKSNFDGENEHFSETVHRLIKRIRHRIGRGIPSSSGHIEAAWKGLPPALHSVLLRAQMSWMFCDKQEPVTLDFFIPLLDAVSSAASPFRTWSENFAAQPRSTVSVPTRSTHKAFSTPCSPGSHQRILKSFPAFK